MAHENHRLFDLWQNDEQVQKSRIVPIINVGRVQIYCGPEADEVVIQNQENHSHTSIPIDMWNSFAKAELQVPTYQEWLEFWGQIA